MKILEAIVPDDHGDLRMILTVPPCLAAMLLTYACTIRCWTTFIATPAIGLSLMHLGVPCGFEISGLAF